MDAPFLGGNANLRGGAGNDHLIVYSEGGIGGLNGGDGYDTAHLNFSSTPQGFTFDAALYSTVEEFHVSVFGGYQGVKLYGADGNDELGSYDAYRPGASGNDYIDGRGGDDVLNGGGGADRSSGMRAGKRARIQCEQP